MKMKIQAELKAMGVIVDANEFTDQLADLFAETNRDQSVDNFRCRWRDVRDFCLLARQRMSLPENCDELIIRTLDNYRRDGGLNVGSGASPVEIKGRLASHGIEADVEDFNEVLRSTFRDYYNGWTVDQLLNRWSDSGHFCAIVRERFGVAESRAVDSLILAGLLGLRKHKLLRSGR
jgi:hypothetical protein